MGKDLSKVSDDVIKSVRDFRQNARELILEKGKCELCGNKGSWNNPLRGHHRIRPTEGGTNEKSNIVVLCEKCYREKIIGKKWHHKNSYVYELIILKNCNTYKCDRCGKWIGYVAWKDQRVIAIKETDKQNTFVKRYHPRCVSKLKEKGINLAKYKVKGYI